MNSKISINAVIFALVLFVCATVNAQEKRETDVKDFCAVAAKPADFLGQKFTLRGVATVFAGGTLLSSDKCELPDISLHYFYEYEKNSNAEALKLFKQFEKDAYDAQFRNDADYRTVADVLLEGKFEKNSFYKFMDARGDKTVAAWDYNYQYAFTVTRIVSVKKIK